MAFFCNCAPDKPSVNCPHHTRQFTPTEEPMPVDQGWGPPQPLLENAKFIPPDSSRLAALEDTVKRLQEKLDQLLTTPEGRLMADSARIR